MRKHKLLIYSDCYIYGGSEKLISFIVKNEIIQDHYQITFVYRNHEIYQKAINKEYNAEERKNILFPVAIASNATFFYKIELLNIPTITKKIIRLPFYVIDKIGIFFIYNFLLQMYVLLKFSPDIVHINNGGYPGASSCSTIVFASKLLRIAPVVYQINNTTFKTKSLFQRYFDSYINKHVNCFITASKHAKEKLVHYRKFDADKIIQVPNTILEEPVTICRENLLNNLKIKPTDFVLCNIGFLSKRKGQIFILEALNLIRIQNPVVFEKIALLLIGDGEEETSLKQYADSFNLNKQVHFLGYQSQPTNYLNSCDLFVFPSIAGEDMPLVILSAMNLGKTILATDFAGIREELEDKVSGIIIPANTDCLAQTLADKIIDLYCSRQNKLGYNAKKRYDKLFSNSIYGKRILDIYNLILPK
tara:strand:+ start:14808 stop:16064 length:1257 start_codon:yes stop_codon:yes gene_type:complete